MHFDILVISKCCGSGILQATQLANELHILGATTSVKQVKIHDKEVKELMLIMQVPVPSIIIKTEYKNHLIDLESIKGKYKERAKELVDIYRPKDLKDLANTQTEFLKDIIVK